ncbi:MAG TPA: hypothetical protein ENK43_14185 [Planctomycetes bacterium]|nr:hypothetical protein [Planctomycetota bacterium]
MLEEIRVDNLLLLDGLTLSLHPGFNVVSGETGMGKSMLLSAIGLLFGDKLPAEPGAKSPPKEVRVEGRFLLTPAERARLTDSLRELVDDELVIRVLRKPGAHQRCYVNGTLVSRKELALLRGRLVEVHGQRDTQKLLRPSEQVELLDRFGGHIEAAREVARLYDSWQEALQAAASRVEREEQLRDRRDLLELRIRTLREAKLDPGEADRIGRDLKRLSSAKTLASTLDELVELLEDEGHRLALTDAAGRLERSAGDDEEVNDIIERVFALTDQASDLALDCRKLAQERSNLDGDPSRLEERLATLHGLMTRFQADEEELLRRLEAWEKELARLDEELDALADSEMQSLEREDQLRAAAAVLAERREKAGARLIRALGKELKELRMPQARMRVVSGVGESVLSRRGLGQPRFEVATNPGQDFVPLEDAVSGGELSRILLALESILAADGDLPFLIFDEIEGGVGPRLGDVLGEKLAHLARHRQLLCITHLPQIAAKAEHHITVTKVVEGGMTRVRARTLEGEGRCREIAAMLGGGDDRLALAQARRMLGDQAVEEAAS